MRTIVFRLVVMFFTRPIKLSDAGALFGRLRRTAPAVSPAEIAPAAAWSRAAWPEPPTQHHEHAALDGGVAVDVSEQPLDTLPVDLQDELRHSSSPKWPP